MSAHVSVLHVREGEKDQHEPIMKMHSDDMEPVVRSILHFVTEVVLAEPEGTRPSPFMRHGMQVV